LTTVATLTRKLAAALANPAAPKNFNPSALTMEIFQEYFAFAA